MKTRAALLLIAGMAVAGLIRFLLSAALNYRFCRVHLNEGNLIAKRDAFNELLRNVMYNSGGNTSLLVGGITAIQNRDSALRGLLASSRSALVSTDLQGADSSFSSWSLEDFRKAVADQEKEVFVDLVRVIDDTAERHNITYFMTFGTMLGSFRHHDMTPWDDDADVAMPYEKKATVWMMLNSLGQGYAVNVTADTQFRFVGRKSRLYSSLWQWRWPYVDIDFYKENRTHIWMYSAGEFLLYDKTIIFPLHRRPLGPVSLNAPRDGLTYLTLTYSDYASCSTGMQHRYGRVRPRAMLPCSVFSETYPFVHRSLTWDQKVMETLKLGSKVLYSVVVDEPIESAAINPFTLESV